MTDAQRDRIDRLFEEALACPPEQRAAFLEERCEETDVRQKVVSLLEDYEEASDLFDGLADKAVAPMLSRLQGAEASEAELRGSDPLDLEGKEVGRYAVEEHLGGGGMGVVYKARDPELSRPVALKFLPPHLAASKEADRRFVREARAASALEHPHIATIYEIGRAEEGPAKGQRFIAMAYYEGETLKEKIGREGPLPIEEAVGYAEQIAEALSSAHEAGIVHRDVKPANVMVTEAGEVKLVDFGLARIAGRSQLTEPGRRLGTAAYMSPEQAEGKEVGPEADQWALGVLLYEMLTGERPFGGERSASVLRAVLDEDPVPIGKRRGEVPPALEQVVGRCLRKDPGERYALTERLLKDLRGLRRDAAPGEGSAALEDRRLGREEESTPGGPLAGVRRFVRELRRRRVIRVAAVYAGTAFVILQLGEILVEPFGLPGWTLRLVTFLLVLGFPLAVGLAWVFDITEEGLVRTGTEGEDIRELGPGGKPFTSDWVLIGLLVLIAGLLLYPRLTGPAGEPPSEGVQGSLAAPEDTATARLDPRSVAVLPFTYLAAEDSTDYFSLGMTDELITRLSQIEDLSVRGRTSVMRYRNTDKSIPQISRELNVAHVIEGSVTKVGGRIRVQVQLLDARADEHLWTEGYTRPFEDVLQLQVDLAREVADQLEATLLPETEKRMAGAARVDSAAYALYLQGRKLRFQETSESLTTATRLLRRSIAIDSTFAPAWALLSFCAWFTPVVGGQLPEGVDRDSLAHRAARRALKLDSTSAEAHIAMGLVREVLDHNFPAAGPHFKRAVELNPGLANAHREYGLYLQRMARFEAAERQLRKAARLDPASAVAIRDLGWNDLFRGNYAQAEGHLKKVLELLPDQVELRVTLAQAQLGQDSVEAALRQLRRAGEAEPTPWRLGHMGWAYGQAGRLDSTKALLSRLQRDFEAPFYEAALYAALEKPDRALDRLEQAGRDLYLLKVLPLFESLRGEPRFQRILKEMGLDEATVQQTMKKLDPESPVVPTERPQGGSGGPT